MPEISCLLSETALKACVIFSSKEETRYYLQGVHVKLQEGRITYTATDGHRLLRVSDRNESAGEFDIIIPAETIRRLTKSKSKLVELRYNAQSRQVTLGDIITAAIDGTFPDAARAIPEKAGETFDGASVNALYFADFGKAFKLLFENPLLKVWPNIDGGPYLISARGDSPFTTNGDHQVVAVLIPCRV